jgi:hypothetical protein
MWFVLAGVALIVVTAAGVYVRSRIAAALATMGVRPRRVRVTRWVIGWLLFAFPVVMVATIVGRILLGVHVPVLEGRVFAWLCAIPFGWAMLVVLQSTPWFVAIDVAAAVARRGRAAARVPRARAIALLVVAAAFAVYTPARVAAERDQVRLRRHVVSARDRTGAARLRIAFVADVQQSAHTDAASARAIYARLVAEAPDLALSGGDWIDRGPDHIA